MITFDNRNIPGNGNGLRGARNQEFYLVDYRIEEGSVLEAQAQKKAVGSCSIVRLKSKASLVFTRSLTHIREDATDIAVLWFVKRGRLCISHPSGDSVAGPGEFAITKSMTPFSVECQTDGDSRYEVLTVILPTHVLRRYFPQDVRPGFCTAAQGRAFMIAERILADVLEDTGDLADQNTQLLVDSALIVLSDAIKRSGVCSPLRQSLSDKRLQDVLRFIDVHLSDPKLSIATVAKGCGISPRYLSFLLKHHGEPFSTLVWDRRLKVASQWLSSTKPAEASVREIAYRIGFKSAAHFSRMFKRCFAMSPSQYRDSVRLQATRENRLPLADGSNRLQ